MISLFKEEKKLLMSFKRENNSCRKKILLTEFSVKRLEMSSQFYNFIILMKKNDVDKIARLILRIYFCSCCV